MWLMYPLLAGCKVGKNADKLWRQKCLGWHGIHYLAAVLEGRDLAGGLGK
jgi:hypothetical protein